MFKFDDFKITEIVVTKMKQETSNTFKITIEAEAIKNLGNDKGFTIYELHTQISENIIKEFENNSITIYANLIRFTCIVD